LTGGAPRWRDILNAPGYRFRPKLLECHGGARRFQEVRYSRAIAVHFELSDIGGTFRRL